MFGLLFATISFAEWDCATKSGRREACHKAALDQGLKLAAESTDNFVKMMYEDMTKGGCHFYLKGPSSLHAFYSAESDPFANGGGCEDICAMGDSMLPKDAFVLDYRSFCADDAPQPPTPAPVEFYTPAPTDDPEASSPTGPPVPEATFEPTAEPTQIYTPAPIDGESCNQMCSWEHGFRGHVIAGRACLVEGISVGDSNFGMTEQECTDTLGGVWTIYTCKAAKDYLQVVTDETNACALKEAFAPKCCYDAPISSSEEEDVGSKRRLADRLSQ